MRTGRSPIVLQARLGDRSYAVWIAGDTEHLSEACKQALAPPVSGVLIADERALALHGDRFRAALAEAEIKLLAEQEIPSGESSKTLGRIEQTCEALAHAGLDRSSVVFALGGGVTGDLAGFVAASFLRGIRCVQLPTTLLAQVDSSIGGKTGVNLTAGKNLVGAFWQPQLVYADTSTLETLPTRELAAGWAEVIKYGVIRDSSILDRLESQVMDPPLRRDLVARCAEIKLDIISRDEREAGDRALLNFGHTVGHAIEAATGYTKLLHGEAVGLGMLAAARVSVGFGGDRGLEARLQKLLERFALPTDLDRYLEPTVLGRMGVDKKRQGEKLRFVIAERPGLARLVTLTKDELQQRLMA